MKTLFITLALLCCTATLQAQSSAEQLADLIHGPSIDQALTQASELVAQDKLALFEAERPQRRNEAVQLLAGVYSTNFNATELAALISFYNSATGQKLASVQRSLGQQAAVQLQEWRGQLEETILQY